jgi:integrase
VTLSEAREAALANARSAWRGIDPLEAKRQAAAVPTFRQAAEAAIEFYSKAWGEDSRSPAQWRQRLSDYCYPRIGSLRVNAITSADVLRCVSPIWATKHSSAQRTLDYIRKVLAHCVANGYVDNNVAKGDAVSAALPKVGKRTEHREAIDWRDLPDALQRIDESQAVPTAKLAIRFLALSAARSGEVREMTWDEVEGATWSIPARRMKAGREHRVPLSQEALAVLAQAKAYDNGSGLVFPGSTGKAFPDSSLMHVVRKVGLETTVHGLRSSFKVWADEMGYDHRVSEFALAHVDGNEAVRAYARGDLYERRALMMSDWARAIQ